MEAAAIFVGLALLISSASVECGYSSASSSSSANGDGTGHTFTHTNNNGQQSSTSSGNPGGAGFAGAFPQQGFPQQNFAQAGAYPHQNFYAPSTYNPGFSQYGPGFQYNPFAFQQPQFPFNNYAGFNAPLQQFPYYQQPLVPPQEVNKYLNSLQQQYAHGGVSTRTTPGATAFASSYLGPNTKRNEYYKQQQDYLNSWNNQANAQSYGPAQGQNNYAYATGAYGPNGIRQTVGANPPNKNKPNIDISTRFASDDGAPGGYYGVSSGSFSSSSNVNGVEQSNRGGFTSVNDNGKITTYSV